MQQQWLKNVPRFQEPSGAHFQTFAEELSEGHEALSSFSPGYSSNNKKKPTTLQLKNTGGF